MPKPKLSTILQTAGATLFSVAIALTNVPAGLGSFGLFCLLAGVAYERAGK